MKTITRAIMTIALMLAVTPFALADNFLKNADFKEGSQLWRGDAQEAFLNKDGTEGQEGDPDVTPVLRVALSRGQWHMVYQDFTVHNAPAHFNVSVQVMASIDFKRSKHAEDYQSEDYIPSADFAFRITPYYNDRTASLKPGQWVSVKESVSTYEAAEDRAIYFFIPPGEGVVYLKNPSVTP